MPKIKLNLNETVNPYISTVNGEYVPHSHQLYVSCYSSEKELYEKFGWYLGCIYVGSNNLCQVKKKVFSKILSDIAKSINLNIDGEITELKSKIISSVDKIIIMVNKKLDKDIQAIKITSEFLNRFN